MASSTPKSASTSELRIKALTLRPEEIRVTPSDTLPNVWGILMESVYGETPVTLLALADGTTSLYFGNGGGILGAGMNQNVRLASNDFLRAAEEFAEEFSPTTEFPLPDVGRVRFYILTYSGVRTFECDEAPLVNGKGEISGLFYSGHNVIAQIRHSQESK